MWVSFCGASNAVVSDTSAVCPDPLSLHLLSLPRALPLSGASWHSPSCPGTVGALGGVILLITQPLHFFTKQ